MLISLNWLRDFVEIPADVDPRALAEKFTVTTAEVDGVEHITCESKGLVAGRIAAVDRISGDRPMFAIQVELGKTKVDSVTIAEHLKPGDVVIYAPPGATVPGVGEVIKKETGGGTSRGMVVSGDALGLSSVGQRAVWLPPSTEPGSAIDLAPFHDWIIEVDNKSLTNRPDLWGHYGIAREIAAMLGKPLRSYDVVAFDEPAGADLPEIPIVIDDPEKCPRYSGLRFTGVRALPSPLAMQVRLAHVGLRPIDILVDLTNYIMLELGQPMHAFDARNIDRIEVAGSKAGETFTTLDGVERKMPEGALMIQCNRKSIAVAGIMGGADTEVSGDTIDLLLESANFEPATIRRCATTLGHRTDASARFEKSLDPNNTVLAIQRFAHLAKRVLPDMKLTSKLSDAFPKRPATTVIRVDPKFVGTYMGRDVSIEEIERILAPLEFKVAHAGGVPADAMLDVTVPSYRATKDVTIEVDVIEEISRSLGYDSIAPELPTVRVRYIEPDTISQFERKSLRVLCGGMSYAEIHRYIWFDDAWLKTLGYDPGETITLRNPASAGCERLRTTLVPGVLAAIDRNRHHQDSFELVEFGSAFAPPDKQSRRMVPAVVSPGRKDQHENNALSRLKTDLETWSRQTLGETVAYAAVEAAAVWEHPAKTGEVHIAGSTVGRITAVPQPCKRKIDEHLPAWSIAIAEINLDPLNSHSAATRKLSPIPVFPRIDLDFSVLADASRRYADLQRELAGFDHALLRRLAFVGSFEGGSVPAGQRSFTFRATIGDPQRTLTEDDIQNFRGAFMAMLEKNGLTLRA